MKRRINITLLTLVTLATAVGTQAGELGHYAAGVPNIRDFFMPEPGFYYVQYHYLYSNCRQGFPATTACGRARPRALPGC